VTIGSAKVAVETDFPSLTPSSKASTSAKVVAPKKNTVNERVTVAEVEEFPSLLSSSGKSQKQPGKQKQVCGGNSQRSSSYASAIHKPPLSSSNSAGTGPGTGSSITSSASVQRPASTNAFAELLREHQFLTSVTGAGQKRTGRSSGNELMKVRGEDWVDSGDSLRRDYVRLRDKAREYAVGRNKFLQEATQAFIK
jgi:hypothetical protein